MIDKLNLEGKKIVVTGGGTGLGREMALAMAKSGADVVLGGRRHELIEETALLIEKMSRRSLPITTDVTDSSQVNRLFDIAISEFGAIDVLVNNAGMVKDQGGVPIIVSKLKNGEIGGVKRNIQTIEHSQTCGIAYYIQE